MNDNSSNSAANKTDPQRPDPASEAPSFDSSVAGEEDPGASVEPLRSAAGPSGSPDQHGQPGRSDQPGADAASASAARPAAPPLAPGDEAAPGTPGTGENLCPACGGSGRQGNEACPECEGTGKVTVGLGGA